MVSVYSFWLCVSVQVVCQSLSCVFVLGRVSVSKPYVYAWVRVSSPSSPSRTSILYRSFSIYGAPK